MGSHRRVRRSEHLAVRRWLQLGAASAAVGAGLLGFSLLGPQIGSAAADTTTDDSASAGTSASDNGDHATDARTVKVAEDSEALADGESDDAEDPDAEDSDADSDIADDSEPEQLTHQSGDYEEDADVEVADEPEPSEDASGGGASAEYKEPPVNSSVQRRAAGAKPKADDWSEVTGRAIDAWTSDSRRWINSLPVDSSAKSHLNGALWATRRTFFNQAPTLAPTQLTGKLDGPVTGTVGAVDPEGDRLVYVVTREPKYGSVQVNSDGTYTYVPGERFDGVDTFRVAALDVGPHVNLLNPFRPIGTGAGNLINQRAIKFEFVFTEGAEHWTPERIRALQSAADDLVTYLLIERRVVLTYDVIGRDDPESNALAAAYSELTGDDPGFYPTVVQRKLLTGIDDNGADADGWIRWNFGWDWALGDTVGPDEYYFNATAVHELLHTLGFSSDLDGPGENEGYDTWQVFDGLLVTRDGRSPFTADHEWDSDFDPYLVGYDGGLHFGGAHAVAVYGGPVPLYIPKVFSAAASVAHLDTGTFTGAEGKVMNHAAYPGVTLHLSSLEFAILQDLGYRVDPLFLL